MGAFCCRPADNYLMKFSKKIMQVRETESDKSQMKVFQYDLEFNTASSMPVDLKILRDLHGISQINFNNKLFLCGGPEDNSIVGSFLILYDSMKSSTSFQINSIYNHYSPTLAGYSENFLLVLSGKNSIHCELFNIDIAKWKYLPDLPEVRYGSSAYIDIENDLVYLFGGLNDRKSDGGYNILRLQMNACLEWEEILFKRSSLYVNRGFSSILSSFDHIYIIGGFSEDQEICDEIIEVDLKNGNFKTKLKLPRGSKFSSLQGCVDFNNGTFYLIDDDFSLLKLELNGFRLSEKSLLDIHV